MKKWILIALMASISTLSQAQLAFSPGYVVRKEGDTLRGFLKNETEKSLLNRVNFKQAAGSDFTSYTPSDVLSFCYYEGPLYRRISFVNSTEEPGVPETRFGKVLVEGAYTLYGIPEAEGNYYVVKSDTATYFLYNDKIVNVNLVPGNYLNMLNFFSAGCDRLNESAASTSFGDKSLSTFIDRVNQCHTPGSTSRILYKSPKPQRQLMIYAGGLPMGSRNQVTAEAVVRLVYPSISANASVNIGFHYSYTENPDDTLNGYYYDVKVKETHTVFSIPLTVQYNFTSGVIQPYVYAGFSASYFHETPASSQLYNPDMQKFGLAMVFGGGVEGYINHHLAIKADWRYELLMQYPSIGIAYRF